MACYSPLQGFRPLSSNANGKYPLAFKLKEGYSDKPIDVPCGQCIGCRLERSRQWAVRCMHEASLYSDNCFITLTYDDDHCPFSLQKSDFQKFMKRLRKKFPGTRFFHCGEYGETFGRPHYHAILFNCDFPDKKLWTVRRENRVYRSEILEDLWPFGLSEIGDVTFESAAYVARYCVKKLSLSSHSDDAAIRAFDAQYMAVNFETGEVSYKSPEYVTMSLKPGIGRGWFDKFAKSDVLPHDRVVMNAREMLPPRYYDKLYEILDPNAYRISKIKRVRNAKKSLDNGSRRLLDKLQCKEASSKLLRRNLDNPWKG